MKKIIKFLIIPLILILGLVGCSNEKTNEPIIDKLNPTVTTDEGLKIINTNKNNQDFVLLDVRTKSEYDELYIQGSINKPLMDYNLFIEAISDISKDKYVLIYCRTDNRSKQAYDYMLKAGYEKCQYMLGGITKWVKEGKPIIEPLKDKLVSAVKINDLAYEFLNSEEIKLEAYLYSQKGLDSSNGLYKKNLNISIIGNGSDFNLKLTTDSNGFLNTRIKLNDFALGSYTLALSGDVAGYKNIKTYHSFKIVNEKTNDKILSYEDIKPNLNHVLNVNSEMTENLIKHNILKDLSLYHLSDINGKKITLLDKLDNRPTIIMFGSPTCGACMDGWKYFSSLDMSEFNVKYIVTSVNENNLNEVINDVRNVIKGNDLAIDEGDILFDNVDYLWREVMLYTTTPQLLFLNNYYSVINMMTNTNDNFNSLELFLDALNGVLSKTYGKEVCQKTNVIRITLNFAGIVNEYIINKGEKLLNPYIPSKPLHKFIGFYLDNKLIDLDSYIFNSDVTLEGKYQKIALNQNELDNSYTLIDIRSSNDFKASHLNNAINLPSESFKKEFSSLGLKKDAKIVLYGNNEAVSLRDYLEEIGYEAYYLNDYKLEAKKMNYYDRLKNKEFDIYFNGKLEESNLRKHYGESYLNLEFKNLDNELVKLSDLIVKKDKPTIIMIGSLTCGLCKHDWEYFLEDKDMEYNFIEVVAYANDLNSTIEAVKKETKPEYLEKTKAFKVFDINRYYSAKSHELLATELPTYYILDSMGNLSNVVSAYYKAKIACNDIGNSISIIVDNPNEIRELKYDYRLSNGEYNHLINEAELSGMIKAKYGKFILSSSYYNIFNATKKISDFIRENEYRFDEPLIIYIINSNNPDFNEALAKLDNLVSSISYNFLILADYSDKTKNALISKPYAKKVMLDYDNYNLLNYFTNINKSYFIITDIDGRITNAFRDYEDLDSIYKNTLNTISVENPNKLTKDSIVKPGDITITRDEAFNSGYVGHIDSQTNQARFDYLKRNYGRNYNDLMLNDQNGNNIKLSALYDNKRPTIVSFLHYTQEDISYVLNPLYDLRNDANLVIVLTGSKDRSFDQNYALELLERFKQEAITAARRSMDQIEAIVKKNNPNLEGEALAKACEDYLNQAYDFKKLLPYIYTLDYNSVTEIVETAGRGIHLFLDRNGNLANIHQTYYTVGGVLKSVIKIIGNKISIEEI